MLHHILFFTLSEMCSHTETQHRAREISVGLFWSQKLYRLYEHNHKDTNKEAEYLLFCHIILTSL